MAAGRVFRHFEDNVDLQLGVFHQLDLVCVAQGISACAPKAMVERILATVLHAAEAWHRQCHYGWVDSGMALDIRTGQDWIAIGG